MKRMVLIIIVFAGFALGGGFKKYAGEFLSLGAGSRLTAMGGAGTAVANDVTAAYWNPAGLVEAKGMQFELMHSKQFITSIQQNYLAASAQLKNNSTLAVSLLYLTVNGIKDSRHAFNIQDNKVDYSLVTEFNVGDYALLVSYAKPYNKRLNYGLTVKMLYRDYHSESALGLGFDAGTQYRYGRNLYFGLLLRDLTGTMIAWSTGKKEFITPSLRLGTAYRLKFDVVPMTLEPALDLNILFENRKFASQFHWAGLSADALAGLEVAYKNLLAVRLGMDDLQRFTTGIGLQIPKLRIDYSFTAYENELGNIHRISFHLQLDQVL